MFEVCDKKFAEEGNVLLLALLVMAGIMTAGLAISAIILNEIRQARNIDFSAVAYYAGESGVEQALYKLRKEDAVLNCPAGAGVCSESGYCSLGDKEPCLQSGGNLSNQSSWARTWTDKEWQIYGKIKKDGTLQVDLYDPEGGAAPGVESLKIVWTDTCSGGSRIELSFVTWTPEGGWVDNREKYGYSYDPAYPAFSEAKNNKFSGTKIYRARIKAFNCDITNMTITAWGNDNAEAPQKEIPAMINLNSVGNYSNLRQAIKMTMPRRSPMSGLYDYVLFSECSLVKGEASSCPL